MSVPPAVDDAAAQTARPAVERLAHGTFMLRLGDRSWPIPPVVLRRAIVVLPGKPEPLVTFDRVQIETYIRETIAPEVDRQPDNARFEIIDGRATVFAPPVDGEQVNVAQTVHALLAAVAAGASESALAVERATPSIGSTSDLDRLGIQTLLATGESDFRGSPRNRIHNIGVGAARFHGVLIPPGTAFSFNAQLGPVTKATGYKPELVIKEHLTTPEYGGGLCQVSTTAFRAAVLSGLDITERSNHAYPVVYYGTPGFDATIYPNQRTWRNGTDLKFVNDTPGHILIQTKIEGTRLLFEFWGTSDGREVRLVGPTPYGRKPDGSVRATLTQQIYRGETVVREETFASAYKSPKLFPHVLAANAERESWEVRVRQIAEKDRRIQEEFERKQRELDAAKRTRSSPTPRPTPEEPQ
jgi:vancomycin resistance protein YoaR